jgi:hypothetical protein
MRSVTWVGRMIVLEGKTLNGSEGEEKIVYYYYYFYLYMFLHVFFSWENLALHWMNAFPFLSSPYECFLRLFYFLRF